MTARARKVRPPVRWSLTKATIGTVAISAVLAFGWWFATGPGSAHYWQRRLDAASDAELPALLIEAAAGGAPGLRVVVDALDSPRAAEAAGARRALRNILDRWKQLGPRQAAPRLLSLAESLHGAIDHLGLEARLEAADLALEILLWPLDQDDADRKRLVAACDGVLKAKETDAVAREVAAAEAHTASPRLETVGGLLEHPRLAGGTAKSGTPSMPPLPSEVWVGHESERVVEKPSEPPTERVMPPAAEVTVAGTVQPAAVKAEDLSHLSGFELFTRLHDDDPLRQAAAEAEIKRRGYSIRQVELGRHLTSPDAAERRMWAEALPGLSGLNAKPWLMQLSRDADPDVRLTVITLMATSSDPEMLRRVAEVARHDPDDRVQVQAARALGM